MDVTGLGPNKFRHQGLITELKFQLKGLGRGALLMPLGLRFIGRFPAISDNHPPNRDP